MSKARRWLGLGPSVGIAAMVTLASWAGLEANAFTGFRLRATDTYFPAQGTDSRVIVVGIDRDALDAAGTPWPWPRDVQAAMLDRVIDAGARLVVVDVLYNPATPSDERLAESLRSGDVVLAQAGDLSRVTGRRLLQAGATAGPVPVVAAASSALGLANVSPDADGVARTLPVAVEGPDGELLPSLALAALARLDGAPLPITLRPSAVQIGARLVPTQELGLLEVSYTDALVPDQGRDHYISAARYLAGGTQPPLDGKIVLIGVVDPTLGDQHLTPNRKDRGLPGVFVHANALNTMLTNAYLVPASQNATLAWVFVLALAAAIVVRSRLLVAAVAGLVLAGAYTFVAFARFDRGHVMDLVYPLLAIVLGWIAALGAQYASEVRQKRHMTVLLARYVPASVARQLVGRGQDLPQGAVTFLFTDVVGSTRAWEAWPQAMSRAMQVHDDLIVRSVEDAGGALVRPRGEGDSRFGVFVRPIDGAMAATDIVKRMERESWPTPEPIQVRIALHVGEGELRDGDYYGSPVNRCARIRALASPGQVLVSEATAAAVRSELPADMELRDLGLRSLKDITEPEHIFELAAVDRSWTQPGEAQSGVSPRTVIEES